MVAIATELEVETELVVAVNESKRMGPNSPAVLWLQFGYALWQFIRVAKFCRVPYAVLAHTFMWIIGQWGRPFARKTYFVLGAGREKFYVIGASVPSILDGLETRPTGTKKTLRATKTSPPLAPQLACVSITQPVRYSICFREAPKFYSESSTVNESFVWNYLRDKPDFFAEVSDLLWPDFAIVDRIGALEGLKMICQGDYIPQVVKRKRFLSVPDRELELNQNFMRLLSTIPLVAQARGYQTLSVWISVAIIIIDQLSLVFNWVWQWFKRSLYHLFKLFMIHIGGLFPPRTRETLCTFLSTISPDMMYSDQVVRNFIRINKGDLVYTMSPFNLNDFESIGEKPFERKRRDPKPYTEEEFGRFTMVGDDAQIKEETPVYTHEIGGSKVHSIFDSNGTFFNFINREDIHLGNWKLTGWDESWDDIFKDNILDLLQIMEEMKMLPFRQTESANFHSLHFNMFVNPLRSPEDITYLVAKRSFIIG